MDTTKLNKRIANIPIPSRMLHLSLSPEGFPIPHFVPIINGKPEFRGMDGDHLRRCVMYKICWLCGQKMGKYITFVIGPMCAVNRNSAEPPCHSDCAEYAVKACPFLTQPRMRRNETRMPLAKGEVAGIMIKRNPGVTLLWTTCDYRIVRDGHGFLFRIGDPIHVEFWAEGRLATRAEIMHSIDTGLPILRKLAKEDGPAAEAELDLMIKSAMTLIPTETPNV